MDFSIAQSDSQLSDSCDAADQSTASEQSQDVKIYIPYESAELCITQVQKKSIIAAKARVTKQYAFCTPTG